MKRTLKDLWASSNSSSSGVGPSKKAYNVPESKEDDSEMTAMKKLTEKLED